MVGTKLYATQMGTTILIPQTRKPRLKGSKACVPSPIVREDVRFVRQGDWPRRRPMAEAHTDVQEGLGVSCQGVWDVKVGWFRLGDSVGYDKCKEMNTIHLGWHITVALQFSCAWNRWG